MTPTGEEEELDSNRALGLEWIEPDGLGGFACGTVHGAPTRRYHGLVVTPLETTAERHLFLSRLEPKLIGPQGAVPLATPRVADGPDFDELPAPVAFARVPWPRITYQAGTSQLVMEILGDRGQGGVLVRFTLHSDQPRTLEITPRFAVRRADHLTFQNDVLNTRVVRAGGALRFQPYEALPETTVRISRSASWREDPHWQRGIVLPVDRDRGYDHHEDAFAPGHWRLELRHGESVTFAARAGSLAPDPEAQFARQAADRKAALGARPLDLRRRLELAADDFLQRTPDGRLGVIAGFPWFLEWGRDTFLSLPGLTLARGRVCECWEALTGAIPFLQGGLLPNIFGTGPEDSHYGSADAALWFVRAARMIRPRVDRAKWDETFLPALTGIAEAYRDGAKLGLRFDDQWTLHAGSPELNPTWMDAQTSAGPVTPRHGAPVEIAALGHQLLATLAEADESWAAAEAASARSFRDRFWLEDEERLADLWKEGEADRSLRPNMLFAAALDTVPLSKSGRAAVVRAAEPLITAVGLRTLSPDHPDYVPRYGGGTEERDHAYHQGTVWPWLAGAYVEASLRAGNDPGPLREWIEGFAPELNESGLGHINEVYSAEPPHERGGTFAQAWNTAELLRALDMLDAAKGGTFA